MTDDVVLCGAAYSTYVRTARMALHLKGVPYATTVDTLEAVLGGGLKAHHAFNRMPALRHGGVHLYETLAVVSYIDDLFDGPRLFPTEPLAKARVLQWISTYNDYLVRDMIIDYVRVYAFAGGTDRACIDRAAPRIARNLALLDETYGDRDWLVGNSLTAADLFLAPAIAYLKAFPESAAMLPQYPNVMRAHATIAATEAFRATEPPRMKAKAAAEVFRPRA